jgi:hypothetical protein
LKRGAKPFHKARLNRNFGNNPQLGPIWLHPMSNMVHSQDDNTNADFGDSPTRPCGLGVVVVFLTVHLMLVIFPAWAYFQYDFVSATLHLEEPRVFTDEAVVQANRAIGLTNLVWVLPINVCSIVGLCCCCCCGGRHGNLEWDDRQRQQRGIVPPTWAFTASYMVLGVAIYWPIQFLSSRLTYTLAGIDHVHLHGSDLATLIIVLLLAAWSTWYLSSYQHFLMTTSVVRGGNEQKFQGDHQPNYGSLLSNNAPPVTMDE